MPLFAQGLTPCCRQDWGRTRTRDTRSEASLRPNHVLLSVADPGRDTTATPMTRRAVQAVQAVHAFPDGVALGVAWGAQGAPRDDATPLMPRPLCHGPRLLSLSGPDCSRSDLVLIS